MIEYTLLNVLVLEFKIYCGPDKFYERSKFGQYDEVKNRAPSVKYRFRIMYHKESLTLSSTVILSTNFGGSKAKRISSRRALK